jgi:DNA-binding transcriptional ArsR family regulator
MGADDVGARKRRHGVPRLTPGDVEPRSDDTIGAVFAALADPTRRQVVRSLSRQPDLTASRLAGELPMTRQAVTKHLAALDRAGLVSARREGRETRYTLTPAPLADAMRWMDDVGAEWDARLAKLAERR